MSTQNQPNPEDKPVETEEKDVETETVPEEGLDNLFGTEKEEAPAPEDRTAKDENPEEITLKKRRTWGQEPGDNKDKPVETEEKDVETETVPEEDLDNLFGTEKEEAPAPEDRTAKDENPEEITLKKRRTWGQE